jgi:hypothetical protein
MRLVLRESEAPRGLRPGAGHGGLAPGRISEADAVISRRWD